MHLGSLLLQHEGFCCEWEIKKLAFGLQGNLTAMVSIIVTCMAGGVAGVQGPCHRMLRPFVPGCWHTTPAATLAGFHRRCLPGEISALSHAHHHGDTSDVWTVVAHACQPVSQQRLGEKAEGERDLYASHIAQKDPTWISRNAATGIHRACHKCRSLDCTKASSGSTP